LARGEAQSFDKISGRQLVERIKARGRAASAHSEAFERAKAVGLALPDVEATTNWAGAPVLKVHGTFVAGLASHRSVEPDTLVVRCALDDRERFLADASDTYYLTDYYRPYPVVLARLSHLNRDALRDLLAVSWRMAMQKAPRPARRSRAGAPDSAAASQVRTPSKERGTMSIRHRALRPSSQSRSRGSQPLSRRRSLSPTAVIPSKRSPAS